MNFKFQKNIKFKIFNVSMMKLSKLILNFRKKIKNIQYMYDGCFKIMLNFKKKKLKIFNVCITDVFKLMLNLKKKFKIFYVCIYYGCF